MTTERIDHVAEAKRVMTDGEHAVGRARDAASNGNHRVADGYGAKAHGCWMQAQVHATLALVEAQRTANFVAYAQLLETQYAEAARHTDVFDWDTLADSKVRHSIALDRIREGLGL